MGRPTLKVVPKEQRTYLSIRFAELIERSGRTQTDIARSMGVHIPTVTNLKLGKQEFTEDLIMKAAKAFNMSVSQFWGESAHTIEEDPGFIRFKIPEELQREWVNLLKDETRTPELQLRHLVEKAIKSRKFRLVADRKEDRNE
jgi:transcriptional regulator with XRE-family HTH domain